MGFLCSLCPHLERREIDIPLNHPTLTCHRDVNRGRDGDEVEDYGYNMAHPRRRSNSNGQAPHELKTKFETRDQEPVFDESIHGPPTLEEADEEEDSGSTPVGGAGARAGASVTDAVGADEEKESAASTSGGSIEEEDRAKKV